jgi:hypothetical protein
LNYTCSLSNTHIEEFSDIEVVVFIEDKLSRKMYQSTLSISESSVLTAELKNEYIKIDIIPNPNNGQFSTKIYVEKEGNYKLRLFNVDGKEIYKNLINLNEGENYLHYKFENLTNGTYYLNISGNLTVVNKAFIIQKF